MLPDDSADVIRRRMAELRRELTSDVRGVRESAKEMANPLYYIRRFPWASAAVAVGIGYLLVPKKKQVIQPDPQMLAELLRKNQIDLDPVNVKATSDSQGMLKSLAVMGLTWAVRTGLTYIGEQLAQAARPSRQDPSPNETGLDDDTTQSSDASPIEEPWNTTG